MNWKRLLAAVALADFTALTAYAVYEHGYLEFFALLFANTATVTVLVDLTIALSLVMIWMWGDAKRRGVSATPYLILTATLGSVGPLLYLVTTLKSEAPAGGPVALAAR